MTVSTPLALLIAGAGMAALVLSWVTWARVIQREHYLPGSMIRIAGLWIRVRRFNVLLIALALIGLIDLMIDLELAGALALAVAAAAFPSPMARRGRDRPLVWTRRLVTLSGVLVALLVAIAALTVAISALISDSIIAWWVLPALLAAMVPLVAELALIVALPIEERVARHYQQRAERRLRAVAPTTIAITGSWGKTTTKHHVQQLAAPILPVAISPASFNNRGGLSRTMNDHLPDGTELLVVEMGMYGRGEIRALCEWVQPDIGVIVAIGPMHLERVGSLEGIVAAKSEIIERTSTAVLWTDTPELANLATTISGQRIIRCGTDANADVRVVTDDYVAPDGNGSSPASVVIYDGEIIGRIDPESGLHQSNVACAVGALIAAGIPPAQIARSFDQLHSPAHRATVEVGTNGITTIDDTFNSNPVGARRALERLTATGASRRFVVTPGMMELGPLQRSENADFATAVIESGAEMIVVGRTNRAALCEGIERAGGSAILVDSREGARRILAQQCQPGDAVLWENDLPDHYP
jgi:UDP-N-acetylmuramoyl-tripeptide--D-alanyl-D-alanine ligase